MNSKWSKIVGFVLLLALFALGYYGVSTDSVPEERAAPDPSASSPNSSRQPVESVSPVQPQRSDGVLRVVENAAIKNFGKVIYRGPVDLSATIERIRAGVKHPHRNDGSVFGNREGLLPRQPRGYYHEYVHPTEGMNGPGPQRLVVGRDGDWWYTPDHYASFLELGKEVRK